MPVPLLVATSCHYHDIDAAQFVLMEPETFTELALDSIAINSTSNRFFGDGQSQPRVAQLVGAGQKRQITRGDTDGVVENPLVLGGLQQPDVTTEALVCR